MMIFMVQEKKDMIYPMMMKVDFQSVKQIGKNPKGLIVTWVTNWLIKPFTMY